MTRNIPRLLGLSAALGVVAMVAAAPAGAHVRVADGPQPPRGGYGIVRLVVPTESDTAATVGLTVTLPADVDLTSARTLPIPGWTATVETESAGDSVRVSRITWRANEPTSGLKPSEFGEFAFSAGPWPEDVDTVPLLSDQAYSDGSVVAWNETALDKDSEPEHPAPVVTLATAGNHHGADSHGAGGHGTPPPTVDTALTAAEAPTADSWAWRATSAVALVIALGTAVALAVLLRRTRS